MADTARDRDGVREYFDSPEELRQKVQQLAEMIRNARHFISFTGAGVSTGAGIPDFRSGQDTVLATGPGAWEVAKHGPSQQKRAPKRRVSTLAALPTPTHMLLVELERRGVLKHLVSQNTDGLHRRAGSEQLAELHGNTNLEVCEGCHRAFMRDYHVRQRNIHVHSHETGRSCPVCQGALADTIINFGESLPVRTLERAYSEAEQADLCLALGSSLTVTPAAEIPEIVGRKKRGNLVIVNLQRTPLHDVASLVIHAKVEDVSVMLAEELGLHIPLFRLTRYVRIGNTIPHAAATAVGAAASGTGDHNSGGGGTLSRLMPALGWRSSATATTTAASVAGAGPGAGTGADSEATANQDPATTEVPLEGGERVLEAVDCHVFVETCSADGAPYSLLRRVCVSEESLPPGVGEQPGSAIARRSRSSGERMLVVNGAAEHESNANSHKLSMPLSNVHEGDTIPTQLHFFGRYGEPTLLLNHEVNLTEGNPEDPGLHSRMYRLEYIPVAAGEAVRAREGGAEEDGAVAGEWQVFPCEDTIAAAAARGGVFGDKRGK